MEKNTKFESSHPEGRPVAASSLPETMQTPPDNLVRLAAQGLARIKSFDPSFDPSAHVSADNWYGHKKIKPTSQQLKG